MARSRAKMSAPRGPVSDSRARRSGEPGPASRPSADTGTALAATLGCGSEKLAADVTRVPIAGTFSRAQAGSFIQRVRTGAAHARTDPGSRAGRLNTGYPGLDAPSARAVFDARREEYQSEALRPPPEVAEQIDRQRSSGTPLSGQVREDMEGVFGRDLGSVRTHSGEASERLLQDYGVKALTTGTDIFLPRDVLASPDRGHDRVLAHELAHVAENPGDRGLRFWGGAIHKDLTRQFAPKNWPRGWKRKLEEASNEPDYRPRRIAKVALPYVSQLISRTHGELVVPYPEGPEHGEGGGYRMSESAGRAINVKYQSDRVKRAAEAYWQGKHLQVVYKGARARFEQAYARWKKKHPLHWRPGSTRPPGPWSPMTPPGITRYHVRVEGIRDRSQKAFSTMIDYLGQAFHTAQDRGAHWEGAMGKGHDDRRDKMGPAGWWTDNPKKNKDGYPNAEKHTGDAVRQFNLLVRSAAIQPAVPKRLRAPGTTEK